MGSGAATNSHSETPRASPHDPISNMPRHGGGGPFWGLKSTQPLDSALQQLSFANLGPPKQLTLQRWAFPPLTMWKRRARVGFEITPSVFLSAAESRLILQNLADVGGFAPWHKQAAACNAMQSSQLCSIRSWKEHLNQDCPYSCGHWLQYYGNPLAKANRLLKRKSPVVLHQGMLRQQRQTCTKPMQTTGTQAQGHSTAIWPPSPCSWAKSLRRFSCAFLPGHVNTWPPCQTNTCAIYPNHALLNNSIDAHK